MRGKGKELIRAFGLSRGLREHLHVQQQGSCLPLPALVDASVVGRITYVYYTSIQSISI